MSEFTEIIRNLEDGDSNATNQLFSLVYHELRKLAASHLAREKPGQTLQPTALVHEAYLRLMNGAATDQWNSRGHFFGAAAVAIRRILIENARRKNSLKYGGGHLRHELPADLPDHLPEPQEDLLALDEALEKLALEKIAKIKMPDLNCFTLEAAIRSVKGTARSMGVDVV